MTLATDRYLQQMNRTSAFGGMMTLDCYDESDEQFDTMNSIRINWFSKFHTQCLCSYSICYRKVWRRFYCDKGIWQWLTEDKSCLNMALFFEKMSFLLSGECTFLSKQFDYTAS